MPATNAVEQTFREVENLVYHTAHRFRRRHGGDWGEILSDAGIGFCKAYRTHDPARAAFTTWVQRMVWYALIAGRKRRLAEAVRKATQEVSLAFEPACEEAGERGLSPDAERAAFLALGKHGSPNRRKGRTARILAEAGWCALRIAESFQEIRDALS